MATGNGSIQIVEEINFIPFSTTLLSDPWQPATGGWQTFFGKATTSPNGQQLKAGSKYLFQG